MKRIGLWFGGVLLALALFFTPAAAQAQTVPVEGASFNIEANLADNLKRFEGKRITVVLNSGKELTGTLKAVSGSYLHLSELDGMDFFDGLVRMEQVAAFKARFRTMK